MQLTLFFCGSLRLSLWVFPFLIREIAPILFLRTLPLFVLSLHSSISFCAQYPAEGPLNHFSIFYHRPAVRRKRDVVARCGLAAWPISFMQHCTGWDQNEKHSNSWLQTIMQMDERKRPFLISFYVAFWLSTGLFSQECRKITFGFPFTCSSKSKDIQINETKYIGPHQKYFHWCSWKYVVFTLPKHLTCSLQALKKNTYYDFCLESFEWIWHGNNWSLPFLTSDFLPQLP